MNPQNAPTYVWFVGQDYGVGEKGGKEEGGVKKFMGLPKTASGKVMKHVLRAWSKELSEKDIGKINSTK